MLQKVSPWMHSNAQLQSRDSELMYRVRWLNRCMTLWLTDGADWAEPVRFHPPQRHQQGEGAAVVLRVVPSPAPHWCCKWVSLPLRSGPKRMKFRIKQRVITVKLINVICLCAAGAQVQAETPVRASHLSTGARRSFFCRMKHSRVAGKHEDKSSSLPSTSKKKGGFRQQQQHHWGSFGFGWAFSLIQSETLRMRC